MQSKTVKSSKLCVSNLFSKVNFLLSLMILIQKL